MPCFVQIQSQLCGHKSVLMRILHHSVITDKKPKCHRYLLNDPKFCPQIIRYYYTMQKMWKDTEFLEIR